MTRAKPRLNLNHDEQNVLTIVAVSAVYFSVLSAGNVSAGERSDWETPRAVATWGPVGENPTWVVRSGHIRSEHVQMAALEPRAQPRQKTGPALTRSNLMTTTAQPNVQPVQMAQGQPPVSVALPTRAPTQTNTPITTTPPVRRLNPTNRTITLPVPISDGVVELGQVDLTIATNDALSIERLAFLSVIAGSITAEALNTLKLALGEVALVNEAQLAAAGYPVTYDPDRLTLSVALPVTSRGVRDLRVADLDRVRSGSFEKPAPFSAFLNVRTNFDYVSTGLDQGLVDPQFFFDGAARFGDIVAEYEASLVTGNGINNGLRRQGTRFIYDDLARTMRYTLGDLSSGGRGFQGSTPSGGISVARSYAQLQPNRDVRPRGDQSVTILRTSTVEAFVNDRSVRRFRLDPGTYRLTDFPFTEGSNNVRLEIIDDAGKQDIIRFDLFFNRTLLQPGTSEFNASAGFESIITDGDIEYDTDKPYLSAFYVRGINERLTAGANFQISKIGRLFGAESVLSTRIGTLAVDVAASDRDDVGTGVAANASFSRLVAPDAGRNAIGATFSVEYRSEDFSSVFGTPSSNPFEFQFGASISRSIGESAFVLADVRHSVARGFAADVTSARFRYGQRLTSVDSISFDVDYSKSATRDDVGFRISYTRRFGERGTLRADYESSADQYGLAYQTSRGFGVGAYSANADLRGSGDGVQGSAGINYTANRAELGLNHNLSYASSTSSVEDSRTSLRVGTAIAFAGGQFAVSRPISDSFALIAGHPSLKGATIEIEPRDGGYESRSGFLGPAVVPALAAFAERQISFDVPDAPPGYDLGAGNIRVLPPLHAGYLAVVGSDYSVTVVGKMLDRDGVALGFISGRATEISQSDRAPITLFTNREGRFGATGLRAGQWRIEMGSEPTSVYLLTVPQDVVGVYQAGTLQVLEQ